MGRFRRLYTGVRGNSRREMKDIDQGEGESGEISQLQTDRALTERLSN
jgi:hypothetical protein